MTWFVSVTISSTDFKGTRYGLRDYHALAVEIVKGHQVSQQQTEQQSEQQSTQERQQQQPAPISVAPKSKPECESAEDQQKLRLAGSHKMIQMIQDDKK